MVHGVMSAWFDVNFAQGLLCCDLFHRTTERYVACGLLYRYKILEMDAGSGLCIEVNLARGYLYWVTSHRFRYVSCYISQQTFMLWEIFADFILKLFEGCANF